MRHSGLFCALLTLFLCVSAAQAALWPDQIRDAKRVSDEKVAIPDADKALWDEYGLQQTERAQYAGPKSQFLATLWRFKDPTSAFAAFEWQRPADAKPSKMTENAAETPNGVLFLYGNYMMRLDYSAGDRLQLTDLEPAIAHFPNLDTSAYPNIYLPSQGLIAGSEKYALGPVSLDRLQPGVPASVAAFSYGTEVQIARYRTAAGDLQLAIFSYPNMQIARQRLNEFQKLSGAVAKRVGPLVAVVAGPANPDAAERLLATVSYNANFTLNERVPTRRDNIGDLIINIFILIGIILSLFLIAGIAMGILRRMGVGTSGEAMTVLHLDDHTEQPQVPRRS